MNVKLDNVVLNKKKSECAAECAAECEADYKISTRLNMMLVIIKQN